MGQIVSPASRIIGKMLPPRRWLSALCPSGGHYLRRSPLSAGCGCGSACPQRPPRLLRSWLHWSPLNVTVIVPATAEQSKVHPLSRPVFAYFEVTAACNNHCPGCGNVFTRDDRAPLAAAVWENILQSLRPGLLRLRLTGGEPTLHPEFAGIVALVTALRLPFSLFTNARWQDPDQTLALLRTAPYLEGLLVSLHGHEAAAHDSFTGVDGSFAETVANVQRATAAGIRVSTSTVITRLNYDHLPQVACLANKLGATNTVFGRYITTPGDPLDPTAEELTQAAESVSVLRRAGVAARLSVCIPQCFVRSSSQGCLAGLAYLTVDPWGNVRPCNHAPTICGNLLEQPLEDIWHGPQMAAWRRIPNVCQPCAVLSHCHGGCRALALLRDQDHDPLAREPLLERDAPSRLDLCRDDRPLFLGTMRREPFGYVLVRGNRIAPITSASAAVVAACDGVTTLQKIQDRFGEAGLELVGALYCRGIIDLDPDGNR